MAVEARVARALLVARLSPARHGDEEHVLPPRLLAEAARNLVPVELRHRDVQQRDVGTELRGDVETRESVARLARFIAERARKSAHALVAVRVVGHYEYAEL